MSASDRIRLGASRAPHVRIVGAVSAAHFVSHYYILLLAPLLPFVRADYGVSYTEIGLRFAAFNIVSAALQTPAGFLVDWLGARILLIVGLVIGAGAFMVAGLVNSFWVMVAMFALAGVGNTVYHPADYALLSHHVPPDRIGQAFSIHTFAGMLGSAVAPASLLMMQSLWGWRGAFIGAGILGFAVAAVLLAGARQRRGRKHAAAAHAHGADNAAAGWRLLLSAPILLNLVFFVLLAMMSGGTYNYSVVALGALYGTPVDHRQCGAVRQPAVVGDRRAGRRRAGRPHHAPRQVAALGPRRYRAVHRAGRAIRPRPLALIAAMSVGGFCSGVIMPSRDMIVRDGHPARLVRQSFRLRHHRLQYRRHYFAADFRRYHGPRQPAPGVSAVAASA